MAPPRGVPMPTKVCSGCKVEKAREFFHRNRKHGDRLQSQCKDCIREATRRWRANNPERAKAKGRASSWKCGLRDKFGMTPEDYAERLEAQNGVCAICGKPETHKRDGIVKPLAVDHCHETGAVRGLLCHSCNLGLGHMKDNPAVLQAAARYLEERR